MMLYGDFRYDKHKTLAIPYCGYNLVFVYFMVRNNLSSCFLMKLRDYCKKKINKLHFFNFL